MKKTRLEGISFLGIGFRLMIAAAWLVNCPASPAQTTANSLAFGAAQKLIDAVRSGNTNEVLRLLNNGTDINAKDDFGTTALMAAMTSANTDAIKLLLDRGADVNARNNQGFTALMESLSRAFDPATALPKSFTSEQQTSDMKAHKLLLDKGADIDAKDKEYGDTAMIHLAILGFTNTVTLLLDRGADINAKDNDGKTALSCAVDTGETNSIGLLLARGADINAVDNHGETALGTAKRAGNKTVIRLLQQAGAVATAASDNSLNAVVASGTNTDSSGYVTNAALLTPFMLTNSAGTVITDAVLVKLTPNKFMYKTATGGMGMLPLSSLPEKLREKFGYNPQNAQAADQLEQQKKIRLQLDAQQRREMSAQQANAKVQNQLEASDITRSIKAFAEKEFPNDYSMQEFVINQQTEAYSWVVTTPPPAGVPPDEYSKIKARAADEFPGDYNMQKFVINKQAKAYIGLH